MKHFRAWFIRWAHKSEPKRVDRERTYLWVHATLPIVGIGIALRPALLGLPALTGDSNRILGLLIVWGSGICLIASSMGALRFLPHVRGDFRVPYVAGCFGQLSVVTSLGYYLWALVHILPGIQITGLAVSFGIAAACTHISVVALKECWRIGHLRHAPDCRHWDDT